MKRALEEVEDGAEEKRGRGEIADMGSDVEEFFAVLKRIEATKKQLGYVSMSEKKKPSAEAVTSKPPWRLSFEWEDFCSNGNGSRDIGQSSASVASKVDFKQGDRLTNDDRKQRLDCLRQNNITRGEEAIERLDLNLPATPAGLHLFF